MELGIAINLLNAGLVLVIGVALWMRFGFGVGAGFILVGEYIIATSYTLDMILKALS